MNKLDEAKLNLKNTVEKLEGAIDKNIVRAKNSPALEIVNKVKALQEEASRLARELDDKRDEITYLREQNAELRALVGNEQSKTFQLESRQKETSERIDQVITRVQTYLADKGMAL